MDKIKNFKQLKIWQKGMTLVKEVYKLTEKFPDKEKYGLVSQMRRASVSIPSNIAEGFKRKHNKEYSQFLYITLGSLAELETQLLISEDIGYSANDKISDAVVLCEEVSKMTTSLLKKLTY